jgi:putative oxidoreductase
LHHQGRQDRSLIQVLKAAEASERPRPRAVETPSRPNAARFSTALFQLPGAIMNAVITIFYDWSRVVAGYFTWAAPLAGRIIVGWVFLWSGWQKLHILPRMIENFREWGIPAPEIMAPFASGVELVAGALLLVGLLTRFSAVPMMIVMAVAIASAKASQIDSLETFLGFEEVSYFVMFAWLAIAGPGPVSLDHVVLKMFRPGRPPADYGA